MNIVKFVPSFIITITTVLLAVLIPTMERKIDSLKDKIVSQEEKIENERFNIIMDSFQKSKISSVMERNIFYLS